MKNRFLYSSYLTWIKHRILLPLKICGTNDELLHFPNFHELTLLYVIVE